ncbi:Hypothetical predicted protein [Octopus vulgaris]|uniref:Uncharacterized protein n=1 Tax=Octopus vulgaris TaxID=6645 RepID=A0AA36BI04_OCTVU|nr:Hypothetical predicted protein [Octopus vulgaris]
MKTLCPKQKRPQSEKAVERDQEEVEIGVPIEAIKHGNGRSDMKCARDMEEKENYSDFMRNVTGIKNLSLSHKKYLAYNDNTCESCIH